MTVDPTVACAGQLALLAANSINRGLAELEVDLSQAELEAKTRIVDTLCFGYNDEFVQEIMNTPFPDIPKKFTPANAVELGGVLLLQQMLSSACIAASAEAFGALNRRDIARQAYEAAVAQEKEARRDYAACLRNARLQAARRDGTIAPEL